MRILSNYLYGVKCIQSETECYSVVSVSSWNKNTTVMQQYFLVHLRIESRHTQESVHRITQKFNQDYLVLEQKCPHPASAHKDQNTRAVTVRQQ
jgi:hypothetical protein